MSERSPQERNASPESGPAQPAGEVDALPRLLACILEIDSFARLREQIGFHLANALVDQLAERISHGPGDCLIGRIGRTMIEFTFALAGDASPDEQLRALVLGLEAPFEVDGCDFDLTMTIGAAPVSGRLINEQQLDVAAAALALAQEGHDKLLIKDVQDESIVDVERLSIMRDLRRSMASGELALHYQPKLRCRTERIESAEALLRWHHPDHGLIRTDKVIEAAEASGAIRDLTFWAVDRALADGIALAEDGLPLTFYVNISGRLVADRDFAEWALRKLRPHPGAVGFEITETAVIQDPAAAIDHLQRFAAAGIRIAIDDYGAGLSSLAYLKQLPAHELKIDRMFVSGLTESHRDPLLVRSSIDLAHALEMEVTAEGVDDEISLSLLRVMGCDMVQGYLVSPALPVAELKTFVRAEHYRAQPGAAQPALHGWNVAAVQRDQG